jgi:hypothetical protein
MTPLDWTEWAAIYLAGYNDARSCAHKLTESDLSMAWETYKAKRPRMMKTHPYNPTPHCQACWHPNEGREHDQFCRDNCTHTWVTNGTSYLTCSRCGEMR